MNAQADLKLRWAHFSDGTFSDVETRLFFKRAVDDLLVIARTIEPILYKVMGIDFTDQVSSCFHDSCC